MRKPKRLECGRPQCGRDATLYPVLKFWAEGFPKASHDPVLAVVKMPICTVCVNGMGPEDLLSDEGWEELIKAFVDAGKAKPARKTAELQFVPIGKEDERGTWENECSH